MTPCDDHNVGGIIHVEPVKTLLKFRNDDLVRLRKTLSIRKHFPVIDDHNLEMYPFCQGSHLLRDMPPSKEIDRWLRKNRFQKYFRPDPFVAGNQYSWFSLL